MSNETLLERIRRLEMVQDKATDKAAPKSVESILRHLRNLLNTRQGSVLIADDYGMPDLTNFPGENLSEAAAELEDVMKKVIQKYEPRLRNVRISFEPGVDASSVLRFKLSAEVVSREENRTPVVFETVVTSSGMVKIQE